MVVPYTISNIRLRMGSVNKITIAVKIACASREISISQFARDIGVSQQALDRFIHGKCTSKKISTAVSDLIRSEFNKLGIKIGRGDLPGC